jgi:hypothetical protein
MKLPAAGPAKCGPGISTLTPATDPVALRRRLFALSLLLSLLLHLPLLLRPVWAPPDPPALGELAVTLPAVPAAQEGARLDRSRRQVRSAAHAPGRRRSRRPTSAADPAPDAVPVADPAPAQADAVPADASETAAAASASIPRPDSDALAPVPADPGLTTADAAPSGPPSQLHGVPELAPPRPASPSPPALARGEGEGPPADPLADLPREGEVDYQVTKGSGDWRTGRGTLHWVIDHDHYRLDLTAKAEGLPGLIYWKAVHWSSEGRIAQDRLLPDYFSRGDEQGVRFDWAARTLTFLPSGFVRPLPDGCQDALSVFFQFAVRAPAEDTLTFPVTNADKLDRYTFELTERSRLELAIGSVDTLHISRLHALQENGFEVWLAEDRHFLPVQMRLTHARLGVLNLYATGIRVTGRQGQLQEP